MNPPRWQVIAESQFPWERDALQWLRTRLPDHDPWHAWSNFEFIDDAGKVNEVDLLVLAPTGIYLVEIKSRPGAVDGDAHTWQWTTDGRTYAEDNPLLLANRKAKRLAGVLRAQSSFRKSKGRLPWVEALIFLSSTNLNCRLAGTARSGVYLRDQAEGEDARGIIRALFDGTAGGAGAGLVDHSQARTVCRAIVEAGIRPSNKHRRVGEYILGALIDEGAHHQDWDGRHASLDSVRRRIRIYTFGSAAPGQTRQAILRQAAREFQILEGIDHPGILRVREYHETELGPALVFDHDPKAVRLDFLLREQGERLNLDQRLHLIRQLAETLKYAHQKKLYHRALCPQSILVRDPTAALPILQIMNWRTATRDPATGSASARTIGTMHFDEYVEELGRVYLAPEHDSGDLAHGPHLDVFSLGAIAYHIISGKAPATSTLELHEKLRTGSGLRISDVVDGVGKSVQELVQYSTVPDLSVRFGTIDEFMESLNEVEDELTTPEREATVDPALAKTGERLDGGFTVIRRLGRGSTSDVLLVRPDGSDEELVLKIASDPSHNDRLVAEGEVLSRIRHPNVVEWRRTLVVCGRTAILMRKAGETTLAARLRDEARLSLDLVQRFGEDLIQTVDYLESQGVAHRDIKPENVGMSQVGAKGKLQLVLFDFSLSRTTPENITAGTIPYLDPFLTLRRPPRWDLAAERFALGMTLYELVTGTLPQWGDGRTAPAMLEDEVTLDSELFAPPLSDGLTGFFERALGRDHRKRFDNAEEMLHTWRRIFDEARGADLEADAFDAVARTATATTPMAELGYSVEALNVLETMGIRTVGELLAVDRVRFRYLKGVGDRIRKEIRLVAKRLAHLRPDLAPGRPTLHSGEPAVVGLLSVDELAGMLLPKRPAGEDRAEDRVMALYLGLEESASSQPWPTLGDAARQGGMTRPTATGVLLKARERWLKSPKITEVRSAIKELLTAHGGVMTLREVTLALLAARGSIQRDDAERQRLAEAIVRACVEAESDREDQRFMVFEHASVPLIAIGPGPADYARALAAAADQASTVEPLLTPQRAVERLQEIPLPEALLPLSAQRLIRLATAASQKAALSSWLEIYPRGMAASLAIRQSLGALVGPRSLTVDQVVERVRGRYPEAETLPTRPVLDTLLATAGAGLTWDAAGAQGPAYYPIRRGLGPSVGSSTPYVRYDTLSPPPGEVSAEVAEARLFEERLDHAARAGGFLALTVDPRLSGHAEAELLRRFDLQRLSLDALLIDALHTQATEAKADWQVVLQADASTPGSRDRTNLQRLVAKALPRVTTRIAANRKTTLLVHSGLLARYELMNLVEDLRDRAGRAGEIPGLWILVPMSATGLPVVDGVPVPVISSAQWTHVPVGWIENVHRAGRGAANQP